MIAATPRGDLEDMARMGRPLSIPEPFAGIVQGYGSLPDFCDAELGGTSERTFRAWMERWPNGALKPAVRMMLEGVLEKHGLLEKKDKAKKRRKP